MKLARSSEDHAYLPRECHGKISLKTCCRRFTLRKIRKYPPDFGVGSSVESVRYDELRKIGEMLFTKIGYRGVGSAEFKLDPADGRLKFIELNPRYWMQNELAAFCGAIMALAQYLDLSGREVPP